MIVVVTFICNYCGLQFQGGHNLDEKFYCPVCGRLLYQPQEPQGKVIR